MSSIKNLNILVRASGSLNLKELGSLRFQSKSSKCHGKVPPKPKIGEKTKFPNWKACLCILGIVLKEPAV